MRWFRKRSRSTAGVALLALLVQLALCFNHVHAGHEGEPVFARIGDPPAPLQQRDSHDPADHDPYCVFCATLNLLGSAQIVAAPSVPLPATLRVDARWPAIAAALIEPQRSAFRSRAPPIA